MYRYNISMIYVSIEMKAGIVSCNRMIVQRKLFIMHEKILVVMQCYRNRCGG